VTAPPAVAEPVVKERDHREEAPAHGFLGRYLKLDRTGALTVVALTGIAFLLRFFSPLVPDVFAHPLTSSPISNCIRPTPVDTRGHSGTLCGLAYPYQRGYSQQSGGLLQPPEGEIFDEIYFPVFAHDDLTGVTYFDPEPPLSKELIALGEIGWGWFRVLFQGADGDARDLGFNPFGWRIMSCLFGTLCVPLMYLLAWRLWPSRVFALAAGVLTCFDGMFFVQSRIGMIDIFPIFLILLAYLLFVIHLDSRSPRQSLVTLGLTGAALSFAISAKWISLAAWGSVILFLAVRAVRRRVGVADRGDGTWSWQMRKLDRPVVPGGAPVLAYAAVAFACLVALPVVVYFASWFPFFLRGQFHSLADVVEYNRQAYEYHAHLTATHPYGSPWYSWPFLYRPVAYYYESQGLGLDQWSGRPLVAGITNLGNPWIWWTSLSCLVALPLYAIRERSFPAALILVGFLTQWLPWSRITRVIFMYHMFGALPFMILALAFVLARISRHQARLRLGGRQITVRGSGLAYAHLGIAVLFFAFFYPMWTGLPISDQAYLSGFIDFRHWPPIWGKMWFPSWI
jgi:hypothetical protein